MILYVLEPFGPSSEITSALGKPNVEAALA